MPAPATASSSRTRVAAPAIRSSFAWVLGRNELSAAMFQDDPFVAYRSIERAERLPRAKRYLRATARSLTGFEGDSPNGAGLRVNRECRSYHLGWILYAWAGASPKALTAVEDA